MENTVCRAITLYSYHIPIRSGNMPAQYSTLGFFDGMSTKFLNIDYSNDDLGELWRYTTEQSGKCDGSYSFQNIFVMADDEWNEGCTDQEIWDENTNIEYPLTMVVFLQLKEYMSGGDSIREQCKMFTRKAREYLNEGKVYTYSSVDKNDFIVCLKCRNYHNAVETIKALHSTGKNIVYSYSVFSVSYSVLENISQEHYEYLFKEKIDSICLKGITNSISGQESSFKWDDKYYDFCEKLAGRLYDGEKRQELIQDEKGNIETKNKDRIYDILGDNDFRYIARDVNLGRLLSEFKKDGMLSYSNEEFPFYLFSSSLVLNTLTPERSSLADKSIELLDMKWCNEAEGVLKDINLIIKNRNIHDNQILSIYYALHQLLQSFKVLEISPAKRYDFFSMFHPFRMLLDIVKEKLEGEELECFVENDDMFDFIHKISMTFHSAQRTDIQFFQIQDFNVIVHYSPAKLRAFYAVWLLKLAELYKAFKKRQNKQYSFVFSPGMFDITLVKQLFPDGKEKNRLMLVTLSDNSMYKTKWLPFVLSHEAAHIGCERKRESRHKTAMEVCERIILLEMHAFMMYGICTERGLIEEDIIIQRIQQDEKLLKDLRDVLTEKAEEILNGIEPEKRDDECRRKKSIQHIKQAFRNMLKYYGKKVIADYCCSIKNVCIKYKNKESAIKDITIGLNEMQSDLQDFLHLFIETQLGDVLKAFYYIEEEAYADLITILTLECSMKDYLKVSAYAEKEENMGDVSAQGEAVVVRMAMVIETVCKIAESEWLTNYRLDFTGKWRHGQLWTLCEEFPQNSREKKLAAKIFYYTQGIRDSLKDISKYERKYDPDKMGFEKDSYDFLADQIVWNALNAYLYECAHEYISKVAEDNTIAIRQHKMAKTYAQLCIGSCMNVVQVIEDFLYKNANESIL